MPWPPREGELLPRFDERGGPKAKGFLEMLGIDLTGIDYLEREIRQGIARTPILKVGFITPDEASCTVQFPIAGPGRYSHRTALLRTGWVFDSPDAPPRMTTAFLRGKEHR